MLHTPLKYFLAGLALSLGISAGVAIASFSLPGAAFKAGDELSASAVNTKLSALADAVVALEARAEAADAAMAAAAVRLEALEGHLDGMALVRTNAVTGDPYYDSCDASGGATATFCNLMAHLKCSGLGYVTGWLEGNWGPAERAIWCIRL